MPEFVLITALGVDCRVSGVCSVVSIAGDINLSGAGVDGCGIIGVPGGSGSAGAGFIS